jgi:hypothetical protein
LTCWRHGQNFFVPWYYVIARLVCEYVCLCIQLLHLRKQNTFRWNFLHLSNGVYWANLALFHYLVLAQAIFVLQENRISVLWETENWWHE